MDLSEKSALLDIFFFFLSSKLECKCETQAYLVGQDRIHVEGIRAFVVQMAHGLDFNQGLHVTGLLLLGFLSYSQSLS